MNGRRHASIFGHRFRWGENAFSTVHILLGAVSQIEATHSILKDFTQMHKDNFLHISHKGAPGRSNLTAMSFCWRKVRLCPASGR